VKLQLLIEYEPGEAEEAMPYIYGANLRDALTDFAQWLRSEIKYNEKPYDEVRENFYRIMREYELPSALV